MLGFLFVDCYCARFEPSHRDPLPNRSRKRNQSFVRRKKYLDVTRMAHSAMNPSPSKGSSSAFFRATDSPSYVESISRDGVRLNQKDCHDHQVIMPWIGIGTYAGRGRAKVEKNTIIEALQCGYRAIETARIYSGYKTEKIVGDAIQEAMGDLKLIEDRSQLFIITKQWRDFHGYDRTMECLQESLQALQLLYVDLWLMHWPGPAWSSMTRKREFTEKDPWHYTKIPKKDMIETRSETWRAMEDAYKAGKVRAIGVANFTVQHLETLKKTARLWPPAVNQVELHPLHPQKELLDYCRREGIVVQAYASLGGQDCSKAAWNEIFGWNKNVSQGLLCAEPVVQLAKKLDATPAQVLLSWGLQHNCALIPKTVSTERMMENSNAFKVSMSKQQANKLEEDLWKMILKNHPGKTTEQAQKMTRLCWRSDPLGNLDFD